MNRRPVWGGTAESANLFQRPSRNLPACRPSRRDASTARCTIVDARCSAVGDEQPCRGYFVRGGVLDILRSNAKASRCRR